LSGAGDSSSLRDLLEAAAAAGESVRIIYHGGRQPGAVRAIRPLQVTDTEVRALDVVEGIAKTFVLDRMELPRPSVAAPEYQAPPPAGAEEPDRDLQALLADHVPALQALGWEVDLSPDSISLACVYAYFKNGKPRKRTPISLMYSTASRDIEEDDEDGSISITITLEGTRIEREARPRPRRRGRPYYLTVRDAATTRTFAHGSHAVAAFLGEARRLAPRQEGGGAN